MKQKIKRAAAWFGDSSGNVKLSMVIMGAGQFRYGAKGKGVCFFLAEVLMICYMAMRGVVISPVFLHWVRPEGMHGLA